jgi:hypothetical protein
MQGNPTRSKNEMLHFARNDIKGLYLGSDMELARAAS